MDLWKLIFVILLVAALVGAAAWFVNNAVSEVSSSGVSARAGLAGAVAAWVNVSRIFGTSIGDAFTLALGIAAAFTSVFFAFRLIKWVNGA